MSSSDARRDRPWRTLCLASLGAFLALAGAVFANGLLPGDATIRTGLLDAAADTLTGLARAVNYGGSWMVLGPAVLLVFALSRAARRHWWLWCGILAVAGGAEKTFKILMGRPRPSGDSLGFPSGHATAAAAFAVLLIYLASRERLSPGQRLAIRILGVLLVVSVGLARILLHAHWPSDVLGGVLLGAGCAAAGAWWDAAHPDAAQARIGSPT